MKPKYDKKCKRIFLLRKETTGNYPAKLNFKYNIRKIVTLLFCLIIIQSFFQMTYCYAKSDDYTGWWVYTYGDYAETDGRNDPKVTWARVVFQRVANASDKAEARLPHLIIIKKLPEHISMALPDGGILISQDTLNACYNNVTKDRGDSLLAFILGHELSHLSNKDHIHSEAFNIIRKYADEKTKKELLKDIHLPIDEKTKTEESKKKEILADNRGILAAAMAGYNISSLTKDDKNGKNNHLKTLSNLSGKRNNSYTTDDPTHPSMQKRIKYIQLQLTEIIKHVELFKSGIALFQIGSYNDAASAFIEFSKTYPSREVFNNIGACYLNLATDIIHLRYSDDYYRFKLATSIDYSTTANTLTTRGSNDYLKDKDIKENLNKAYEFFKIAASRDPYNRDCRYNLSATAILKKEYAAALDICDEILKRYPKDNHALNNKAIAFYYYGKKESIDTAQKSIQTLENVLRTNPLDHEILYNLAALKEIRNRIAGAKNNWEMVLNLKTVPRDNFYKHVYKKIYGKTFTQTNGNLPTPSMPPGIKLGENITSMEKKFGKSHIRHFKLGSQDGNTSDNWAIDIQVLTKENLRIIAIAGTVEIVEKEYPPHDPLSIDASRIIEKFGPPIKILQHTAGKFYIYKDKGFSITEIDGKVKSILWFDRGF